MGKPRKQKRILKMPITKAKSEVRITKLDSVEKIDQYYQSLSPVEQEAMRQDVTRIMQEHGESPQYPPGTRFVDKALLDRLTEDFMQNLDFHGKTPEPGDRFKGTSEDGYTVEAWIVPTQMPEHPIKGIPFAMHANVFDSKGHYLAAKEDAVELPKDGQVLHDYYIHHDVLDVLAFVHSTPDEGVPVFPISEGDCLLFYPHWYRGCADGSLQYVGKSDLEPREGPPSKEDVRLDVEILLGISLDQRMKFIALEIAIIHLSEYKESAFGPGDYVGFVKHLYEVNEHGLFKHIGKFEGRTMRKVLGAFEQLTGKHVGTIHVAQEPEPVSEDKPAEKQHLTLPDENLDVQVYGFVYGMDTLVCMN